MDCTTDDCDLHCPDSGCCQETCSNCVCFNDCTCQFTCEGDQTDCGITCGMGATCDGQCAGKSTGTLCRCMANSSCTIKCTDPPCMVTCVNTAECLLDCSDVGGQCDFTASCTIKASCDNGILACNRDCP